MRRTFTRVCLPHQRHELNELAGDEMYINMLGIKDWEVVVGKDRERRGDGDSSWQSSL